MSLAAANTTKIPRTATAGNSVAAHLLNLQKAVHRRTTRVASVAFLMVVCSFGLSMLVAVITKI